MIAKANVGDLLIGQNTSAMQLKPQSVGQVDFRPVLRPMFTGSPRVDMKLLIISAVGGDVDPTLAGITRLGYLMQMEMVNTKALF